MSPADNLLSAHVEMWEQTNNTHKGNPVNRHPIHNHAYTKKYISSIS